MKLNMLKTGMLFGGLLAALAGPVRAGTNDLTSGLQKGLFEEEANHNLPAAIEAYKSAIAHFDKDRRLAATAVFRLGECYRKLGNTNEAAAQYERIVREFPDQGSLVELSRQHLPVSSVLTGPVNEVGTWTLATVSSDTKAQYLEVCGLLDSLRKENVRLLMGLTPESTRVKSIQEQIRAKEAEKKELERQNPGLVWAAANAAAISAKPATEEQKRLLVEEIKVAEQNLALHQQKYQDGFDNQTSVFEAERQVLELKRALAALEAGSPGQAASAAARPAGTAANPAAPTSEETEEIARIQEMVKNSPDLINAPSAGLTPLIQAANRGQLSVAEYLLRHGADPNRAGEGRQTPLLTAAGSGHLAMVELLLRNGAVVNDADKRGVTPLQAAAKSGYRRVVEALLAAKADVNAHDMEGHTALHLAAHAGSQSIAADLAAAKANVNAHDTSGDTPLHLAARAGSQSIAADLVAAKADVNARNTNGDTPLHVAAARGQTAIVALFLAHKADVDAKNTNREHFRNDTNNPEQRTTEGTPLVYAILCNHADIVKLLLAAKADANAGCQASPGQGGYAIWCPPVYMAVYVGSPEIVSLLLDAGADPNTQVSAPGTPSDGWTPLELAAAHGKEEIARMLLAHKADPNVADGAGQTPLHHAVFADSLESVKLLLAASAKVDPQDRGGGTPLCHAVMRGDTAIAAALLEAKADPNLKDSGGLTPLQHAVRHSPLSKETVELLLTHGADPNTPDSQGNTPLGLVRNAKEGRAVPGVRRFRGVAAPPPMPAPGSPGAPPMPGPPGVAIPGPGPGVAPPARGGQGSEAAGPGEIADLLRAHGAVEHLPRLDQIEVQRPGANSSNVVFSKGKSDYNHFTLYELLAVHYGFVTPAPKPGPHEYLRPSLTLWTSLSFPDLERVTLRRPTANGLSWGTVQVHLRGGSVRAGGGGAAGGVGGVGAGGVGDGSGGFGGDDCQGNVELEWGDVVEIPETDHPINAVWLGFPEQFLERLKHCLDRQVQLTVKGQTTNLFLRLQTGERFTPPSFALWAVLQNSGLLRASSDLSRVKVKRVATQRIPAFELTLDCSDASSPGADFWLRGGDFIEVPERQTVSNALGGQ